MPDAGRTGLSTDREASVTPIYVNRRQLLAGSAGLAGTGLLAACGSPSAGSGASSTPSVSRPPVTAEPTTMSILEWGGYEAAGTKAQTAGMTEAGKSYIDKYGPNSVTYTYITDDDQALQKATSSGPFDLLHPCHENIPDYVTRNLVQPWDTDLLPSFSQLNPYLVEQGKINGKQYMIPWDWGYGSLTYRTDHVDAADATGWELAWNPKYKGKISLWSGASTNFEVAALKLGIDPKKMDNLSDAQLEQCKQSLLEQKPLNKFYWESEYGQMQPAIKSGTVWIAYSWQDTLVSMKAAKVPVEFLNPSQQRLSWFCGFMLGKDTANYYHAHEYVESFINKAACAQMTNAYAYGTANTTVAATDITDQALAQSLQLGDPHAIATSAHLQSWAPNRSKLLLAWQEVKSA
jgi:spermidine/putrescine transport system substrate-binding protein